MNTIISIPPVSSKPGTSTETTASKYQSVKSEPGELIWMSIKDLAICEEYQRPLSGAVAKRIAKTWNWDFIKPLTVALRQHGWYIVDGQHQHAAALLRGDIDKLPVYVISTIEEVKTEAAAFLGNNSLRSTVSALQKYHSGLVAKDDGLMSVNNVIRDCGFTVAKPNLKDPRQYRIQAIGAVLGLVNFGGLERLRAVLKFIDIAWAGAPKSMEATIIYGVSTLLHRVKDLDIDAHTMASKIGSHGLHEFFTQLREMRSVLTDKTPRIYAAYVLAKLFDKKSKTLKIAQAVILD